MQLLQRIRVLRTGKETQALNMILEPRSRRSCALGCDGCARHRAMLWADPVSPAAEEARTVRYGRIWGGITKRVLSSPKTNVFGEEGIFYTYFVPNPKK